MTESKIEMPPVFFAEGELNGEPYAWFACPSEAVEALVTQAQAEVAEVKAERDKAQAELRILYSSVFQVIGATFCLKHHREEMLKPLDLYEEVVEKVECLLCLSEENKALKLLTRKEENRRSLSESLVEPLTEPRVYPPNRIV